MNFPIYKRLKNQKSYYRIEAADQMTELQQLGSKWLVHTITARILPERLLIEDILNNADGQFEEVTAEQFQSIAGSVDV